MSGERTFYALVHEGGAALESTASSGVSSGAAGSSAGARHPHSHPSARRTPAQVESSSGAVAQLVEQEIFNLKVSGSSPDGPTSKRCRDCSQELPLEAFHRMSSSRDGRQPRCKACIKAYQQASPTFHANARENARRQVQRRPEQVRAKGAVARAIKRGDLVRQPCELCAATENIDAHHHLGYDHPLDVQWLCRSCHIRIEPRRRKVAA